MVFATAAPGVAVHHTVYPKKYAHGFCFAVLCCGYTLTDLPISIRLTSLALWQSNDCPSASKATLMNMDKYFMWIHYERLHNHNKAKHNKTVCIFLGIYCRKYAYGKRLFVFCCGLVLANFTRILQKHIIGTRAIVKLCKHQWRNPEQCGLTSHINQLYRTRYDKLPVDPCW